MKNLLLLLSLITIIGVGCHQSASPSSTTAAPNNGRSGNLSEPNAQPSAVDKEDFLIVPGKSIGKISLGMTRDQVVALLDRPQQEDQTEDGKPFLAHYKSKSGKNSMDIYFDNAKVIQVKFTSPAYKTTEGVGLSNFESDANVKYFDRYIVQAPMALRYVWKKGGLAFYHLNLGKAVLPPVDFTIGAIYSGEKPKYDGQTGIEQDNGWEPWNGWEKS